MQQRTNFLIAIESQLLLEYNQGLEKEDLFWKRKLRIQWMQQGDLSSRIFYLTTMKRRWENRIEGLYDNAGHGKTNMDDILKAVHSYMAVIVRDENGQLLLLCKGANSIIFERLSKYGRMYEEEINKHLNVYGESGLRTLALAYRKLEESEYLNWNANFLKAKTTIRPNREAQLERIADLMERALILVGATAVEDKLQKGVLECIDKLAQDGLKIWVLTGDKMETAKT